jgi:hypothetical protein
MKSWALLRTGMGVILLETKKARRKLGQIGVAADDTARAPGVTRPTLSGSTSTSPRLNTIHLEAPTLGVVGASQAGSQSFAANWGASERYLGFLDKLSSRPPGAPRGF